MISVADNEKLLESFLSEGDYGGYSPEYQGATTFKNGAILLDFSMDQAPRDTGDLLNGIEEELEGTEICLPSLLEGENASWNTIFHYTSEELGPETLEKLGIASDQPLQISIYGSQSCGDYSDDETDAYINGYVSIAPLSDAEDAERIRAYIAGELTSTGSSLISAVAELMDNLTKYGAKADPGFRHNLAKLNRLSVA